MCVIGFDTSNYTTSIACFDGSTGINCSRLLPVKEGALGLRQSDAVFYHIKSLPELSGRLFSDVVHSSIQAVCVSTQPRAVDGSYMPCFMVGQTIAEAISGGLDVKLFTFSHQRGHVAAALYSCNKLDLLNEKFIAFHFSGGTSDALLIEPDDEKIIKYGFYLYCYCFSSGSRVS